MDLLKDKTGKLYFTFLFSALSSTILTTIYSTVDAICVGQYLGPIGSAAITCLGPFWTIMLAPGILLGIGGAVMMNNRRGANNEDSARKYFTISLLLAILCAITVFLVMFLFAEELLVLFGATDDTIELAMLYMKSLRFAAPTFTLCACIATFIRNDGEAFLPTLATIIGGVINMICDVLFVFDFGLGLGIFGAGLATSLGQIISFLIILCYFLTKKCKLKLAKIDKFGTRLGRIATVGLPVFLLEVSNGISAICFNNIIVKNLGTTHLAIYGTVSLVAIMLQSMYNTIGAALQPIASAAYGAKSIERIRSVFKIALIVAFSFGILFTLFTQIFPLTLLKMFMDVTDEVVKIGPAIFRKYTAAVGVSGITFVISYYLQSTLRKTMSSTLAFARGLIFPCVFAFALSYTIGFDAIWFSVPIAEALTVIMAIAFAKFTSKRL